MTEYEVLYNWDPENAEDLRLKAGETVIVLEKNEHGWWKGMTTSAEGPKQGFFPKNYVKECSPAPVPPPRPQSMGGILRSQTYGRAFSIESLDAFDSLVEREFGTEIQSSAVGGVAVENGMRVTIQCCAMTWDGATTEASVFVEGQLSFTVGSHQVIKGLEEAIVSLKVGDRANVICAPSKAYGQAGQPPFVPPNSHIVYDVTVLSAHSEGVELPAEGDQLFIWSGIESRDARAKSGAGNKKSVVLVSDNEITDDMLAQAAAAMGMQSK